MKYAFHRTISSKHVRTVLTSVYWVAQSATSPLWISCCKGLTLGETWCSFLFLLSFLFGADVSRRCYEDGPWFNLCWHLCTFPFNIMFFTKWYLEAWPLNSSLRQTAASGLWNSTQHSTGCLLFQQSQRKSGWCVCHMPVRKPKYQPQGLYSNVIKCWLVMPRVFLIYYWYIPWLWISEDNEAQYASEVFFFCFCFF